MAEAPDPADKDVPLTTGIDPETLTISKEELDKIKAELAESNSKLTKSSEEVEKLNQKLSKILEKIISINVEDLNGKQCQIKVKRGATIRSVKKEVAEQFCIPVDECILMYNERELSDGPTLLDERIRDRATIKLLPRTANMIPAEILRMDKTSIELYKRALSEGKEAVHNIRVMVVGHYGVGKTTLTKRLFNEVVDISKRESTDGIDVHVKRCKVSLDTGQWNVIDKGKKAETAYHRLIKLLKKSYSDIEIPENKEAEMDPMSIEVDNVVDEFMVSAITNNPETRDTDKELSSDIVETPTVKAVEPKEESVLNHLKEIIKEGQGDTMDTAYSDSADVSVWDFAGQFDFYATHQVFLSRRAIYLLVTDVSKQVDDKVEDDACFIDSTGPIHWTLSEFVEFWLNSIHEFCNTPEKEGPPVILVGTHADKLKPPETKDKAAKYFFTRLRRTLRDKVTFGHLSDKDFAMDNSVEDSNFERLRKHILDSASKQSHWGEIIPAKWITLENRVVSLKKDSIKVLRIDNLYDLNRKLPVPIETKKELDLFLRFHHESGNILYFSDENLHDSIVLDPQWLIDAFKTLITAEEFCSYKQEIFKKWQQFYETGVLTNDLIEAIWKREENVLFHENKELLLNYLEKLCVIAKPIQQFDTTEVVDYYFAPCFLKMSPPEDLLVNIDGEDRKSTSKLCFRTSSGFLPISVFNKLLAACISRWPLSKWNAEAKIFCGCGVFDLQNNHTAYIYFFNHEIQIWLTKFSIKGDEPDRILCSEVRGFVSDLLEHRFKMSSDIEVFVKCPTADLRSRENAFAFDCHTPGTDIVCNCRAKRHVLQSQDLTKYWHLDCIPEVFQDSSRQLSEKDLVKIAKAIGTGWKLLGFELGITRTEMEQICLDNDTTAMRIIYMLSLWCRQNPLEATVGKLYLAMKNCCNEVSFEWPAIHSLFAEI